jgi:hypothetical protein
LCVWSQVSVANGIGGLRSQAGGISARAIPEGIAGGAVLGLLVRLRA